MIEMGLLILLPLTAAFAAFVFTRHGRLITLIAAFSQILALISLATTISSTEKLSLVVGGWAVPLGIRLYADGLTILMLSLAAIVGLATSLYSQHYFSHHKNTQARLLWWPLWLLLWSALNALFLTADIFNLYVTLELLGLSAVALVALDTHALSSAVRYLLVGLLGSLFFLLGVGLLYAVYGTVDMNLLAQSIQSEPATLLAMALMTVGLLLKSALFPLHFWLPPAHANAPAPVSAVLSALVVKACFYAIIRLWYGPFESLTLPIAGQFLAILGTAAIFWGSIQALMAPRLKLVIAYSTVAQIGYLFLLFAFIKVDNANSISWYGAIWLALSHGLAKAGMFLAAGSILYATGHDRVTELAGAGQRLPLTVFTIGIASASLMGLPPSGGFVGKWLLLNAAFISGQWWWALVLLSGGVMTAAYSFRVLLHAFRNIPEGTIYQSPPAVMQWSALALALGAVALGIWSEYPIEMLSSGSPLGPLSLREVSP